MLQNENWTTSNKSDKNENLSPTITKICWKETLGKIQKFVVNVIQLNKILTFIEIQQLNKDLLYFFGTKHR